MGRKVGIYTLGCKVNIYESEVVRSILKSNGYEICDFNDYCDIYIINTCAVTNEAEKKSRKVIRNVKNKDAIKVVMGCYSVIAGSSIDADIVIGNRYKSKIVELLDEYDNEKIVRVDDMKNCTFESMFIDVFDTKTRAFVKIQDGCNNFCSYCIIPYVRGNVRSKPLCDVVSEVKKLVSNGHIELVLAGIHTGKYGIDIGYRLVDLLRELIKIDGLYRIRISSIEITELDDDFLEVLKDEKIANHLHIPLQSGSDSILELMNRKYDTSYFLSKINKIRSIRKDISITTDVIVGFPNESDDLFLETVDFIKKVSFSKLHVFPYSIRNGTKASLMDNQVDSSIKKKRVGILMDLSKELELYYMNSFVGKTVEMIPESYKDGNIIGHTSNYLSVLCNGNIDDINKVKIVEIKGIDYPNCIG